MSVLINEDYDIAAARRIDRKGDAKLKSVFSKQFYKLINKISDTGIEDGAPDFRIMKSKVVDAIISMLRMAGFEAYPAMTMAGSRVESIPADHFNHSVAVVKLSYGFKNASHVCSRHRRKNAYKRCGNQPC